MNRLKELFGEIFMFLKGVSRKTYAKGLVLISAGMVTVLVLGTNGFMVQSQMVQGKTVDSEQSDFIDKEELEEAMLTDKLEESQSYKLEREEEDLNKALETSAPQKQEKAVFYTEEDYMTLVEIVEAEATGEDIVGKIMVANVVLNRVESNRFPNTIYEVVYQKNARGRAQFSPVNDGRMGRIPIKESTYTAVERALKGEDYSNGALFFVARSLSSEKAVSWFDTHLTRVAVHGVHEFYSY